jgi:hypothetical protein
MIFLATPSSAASIEDQMIRFDNLIVLIINLSQNKSVAENYIIVE